MRASVGLEVGLGLLLLIGAALKVADRRPLEAVLVAVMPGKVWRRQFDSRRMSQAVIGLEIAVGLLLLSPLRELSVVRLATVALFGCFLAATLRARSLRVNCGCFGAASAEKATGVGDVTRASLLFAGAAGAGLISESTVALSPLLGTVALALPLVIAFAPHARLAISGVWTAASGSGQTDQRPDDGRGSTRRGFLVHSGRLAIVALGILALGDGTALAGGGSLSCEAAFDLCYGCTTKQLGSQGISCCINCYGQCQLLVPCPGGSCGGCWP
jgi:hypothetical protein